MYKITVIESAEELLRFANDCRAQGNTDPFIPPGAQLVFENAFTTVRLEKAANFNLACEVTVEDIIKELARNANLYAHIT